MKKTGLMLLAIAVLYYPIAALAQEVVTAPPSTVINWGEILQPILMTLGTAIAALLSAILYKVLGNMGIAVDQQTQRLVDDALKKSMTYGVNFATEKFLHDRTIDVKSEMIAEAIAYFKAKWPDTVKKLGLSDEAIKEMIYARLGVVVPVPNVSAT